MLEQKLIVGRLINLDLHPMRVPPYTHGAFVTVPVQHHYLKESTGVFTKTSAIEEGPGPKAHRNFKWLPWLTGAISQVALVGTDVLTGPMSGCWLVTYRKANGVPHAGHIGTDIASPTRTAAVIKAWNTYATTNQGDVIGGFNPLRHWVGDLPAAQGGETAPMIFGLFTTEGEYFAIITYPQPNPTTLLRIAGVQRIASVTRQRLRHLDRPGP